MPKDNPLSIPVIQKVEKLVRTTSEKISKKMQVAMYFPGMFFKHHIDQCNENNELCNKKIARNGLRLYNLLIYLNEGFGGGETEFNILKLKFKPKPGDAICI